MVIRIRNREFQNKTLHCFWNLSKLHSIAIMNAFERKIIGNFQKRTTFLLDFSSQSLNKSSVAHSLKPISNWWRTLAQRFFLGPSHAQSEIARSVNHFNWTIVHNVHFYSIFVSIKIENSEFCVCCVQCRWFISIKCYLVDFLLRQLAEPRKRNLKARFDCEREKNERWVKNSIWKENSSEIFWNLRVFKYLR